MVTVIVDKAVYRNGVRYSCGDLSTEVERLEELGEGFLWVGLKNPTRAEFDDVIEELHLHPLAVEDALTGNNRPKIDVYEQSIFVSLKTLRYIDATSDVETGELMLFVGERFILTVRNGEANPLAGLRSSLERYPGRLSYGPIAVMHAVIDLIVDTYLRIDAELGDDLAAIEERVFSGDRSTTSTEIYKLKREVLEFRRGAVPLVMPLRRLVSGETKTLVPKKLRPFFADVLDHLLQVVDHAENYDHLLSDILSAHLAQVGVQQNEDMRKISAWVAIAALPTMIAGIYGMNFPYMPEFEWHYSYFVVLAFIFVSCGVLYYKFRRSGWL